MLRSHGLNGLQHSHMHIIALCLKQQDSLLSALCLEEFQKFLLMWSLVSLYLTYQTPVDKTMVKN